MLQSRKAKEKGLTELRLKGSIAEHCKGGKKKDAKRERRQALEEGDPALKGKAKGRYRTRGRHSAATVRGTNWTITDRCDGTLTKVKRGKVAVRDFRLQEDDRRRSAGRATSRKAKG